MVVMKFGGSSISSGEKIRTCIRLVADRLHSDPMVVVSAHGKTTNALILSAENALAGQVMTGDIEQFHLALVNELSLDPEPIVTLLSQLKAFLQGVSLIGELTQRTLDHIMSFGERLSTRIVAAAMTASGVDATAINSYEIGLMTNSQYGDASPQPDIYDGIAANLKKVPGIPIITGFLGRDEKGNITTLGRSGSDFSASIIGAAVQAEEVQIWTDVSGIMTCDPSLNDQAQSLPRLSFNEASELAYYGAEVLHPSTLVPAMHAGIPVRVLNTNSPKDSGTLVIADTVLTTRFAKSVVYKEDVNLIVLSSPRLMSAVQILSRAFSILAQHGIGVHMATTSEATVSMVTDKNYSGVQIEAAIQDLSGLGSIEVEHDKAIICVIGEELKGRVDVLGKVFGKLTEADIKARMVSQSASEINVAFLVDNVQIQAAVTALHDLLI